MRSNRALAPTVLLGVTLAALAAGAWCFLARDPPRATGADSAAASSADRRPAPAPASTVETATSLEPWRGSAQLAPLSRAAAGDLARLGRAVFYGRVTTPSGAPCDGATVCYDGAALATTGADGEYRIEVSHRPVAIVEERPRFAPLAAIRPGVGAIVVEAPVRSTRVDLALGESGRLFGRVLSRETHDPLPDARLELLSTWNVSGHAVRTALRIGVDLAEDGSYSLPGLAGLHVGVRAAVGVHGSRIWSYFSIEEGEEREHDLVLPRATMIRGRFSPWPPSGVDDATAARVVARDAFAARVDGIVADDGSFELALAGLVPARTRLALEWHGGVLWSHRIPQPRERDPVVDLGVLELGEPRRLQGRVLLPPALLEHELTLHVATERSDDSVSIIAPLEPDGGFLSGPIVAPFAACGVFYGKRLLVPLGLFGTGRQRAAAPGGIVDLGEIAPPQPALVVRLVDQDKRPVGAGITVDLEHGSSGDERWVLAASDVSDASGLAVLRPTSPVWLDADPDTTRMLVRPSDHYPEHVVQGISDPERLVFREVPLPTGVVQRGRLEDTAGRPLAAWVVLLEPDDTSARRRDVTDADGTFEVTGLLDREYGVLLVAPDGSRQQHGSLRPSPTSLLLQLDGGAVGQ